MARITFNVNSGDTQVWEQNEHEGSVALYTEVDGWEASENKTTIPPGDMVMLGNLYRYIKAKHIRNSWVNPGGTKVVDDDDDVLFALKKQIPQKPDYAGDGYDDNGKLIYDTAYCPNCNHKFEVYYDNTTKYCPDCGQALDWGDEA